MLTAVHVGDARRRSRGGSADDHVRAGRPSALSRGRRRRPHTLATRTTTTVYVGDNRRMGRPSALSRERCLRPRVCEMTIGALTGGAEGRTGSRRGRQRPRAWETTVSALTGEAPTAACVGDDRRHSRGGDADGRTRSRRRGGTSAGALAALAGEAPTD